MKRAIIAGMAASVVIGVGSVYAEEEASWTDTVKVSGDVRLRHESFDQDGKTDRHRQRVRARVSVKGEVNASMKAGLRVASGSDDPVSTNQSFDDAFSSKGFQLDKVYLTWAVAEGVDVTGGKMGKPWINVADLIWDGDLNPEGFAASMSTGDATRLLATIGYFWVDEDSSSSDDLLLYVGQAALESTSDLGTLVVGASIYNYENIEGSPALYDEDLFGNTGVDLVDGVGDDAVVTEVFAEDFQIVEGFASISTKAGDLPVKLYAQVAVNSADDSGEDTAYLGGIKLGKAKKPGQVELGYNYRSIEKNAVLGTFTDSDFGGGGTNAEGHKLMGKVAVADNVSAGVALFLNQLDPDGADTDYARLQVDLVAKF